MALKLNKIDDATIRDDIANNRDRVAKFLAAEPKSPMRRDPVRYSRRLADAELELGLELYQQEGQASEIRHWLGLAGKEFFNLLAIDQRDAVLSPLEFEKALALAICFCPPSVSEGAAEIPMKKFFADPQSLEFYSVLVRYLDLLRAFLAAGKLNYSGSKDLEAECTRADAGRFDSQVTLAKLRALKAVDEGDVARFNQSLITLIEDHENEVKHGENQRSTRGFICLPALMFAHLAAARRIICAVKSPYLPLHLLNH